jgi:hypothetical protein
MDIERVLGTEKPPAATAADVSDVKSAVASGTQEIVKALASRGAGLFQTLIGTL